MTAKLNVHTKREHSGRLSELCQTCKLKGHLIMLMATDAKMHGFRLPLWSRWEMYSSGLLHSE